MRHALATLLLTAASITAVHAADFKFVPPSPDYKTIPAGAYAVDPHHASVTFRIAHMGLSNFTGRFDNVEGLMVYDPKAPLNVNMHAEVKLANLDTGNPELDTVLKGDPFFAAGQYPTIKFEARKLELTGPTSGKLTADVSLRGVTRPVVFDVVFHGHGKNYEGAESLGFSAHATLKRSAFGMTGFPGALGDEVELWLEAEFNQKH